MVSKPKGKVCVRVNFLCSIDVTNEFPVDGDVQTMQLGLRTVNLAIRMGIMHHPVRQVTMKMTCLNDPFKCIYIINNIISR